MMTPDAVLSDDPVATRVWEGPLVRLISKDLSDTISSLHRRNAWIVVALASAHIGAALFYLFALKKI